MGYEVGLVDQLEEVVTDFGRNLEEMVSVFVESIQVGRFFTKISSAYAKILIRVSLLTSSVKVNQITAVTFRRV